MDMPPRASAETLKESLSEITDSSQTAEDIIPEETSSSIETILLFFERGLVILLAVFSAALLTCLAVPYTRPSSTALLKTLHDNWRAWLLMMVPIFYMELKAMVRRVRKLPGGTELEGPRKPRHNQRRDHRGHA